MFIRWKRRRLVRPRQEGVERWSRYAVLVRSVRVNGQPRLQIVRYLAHIQEEFIERARHRERFWARVNQRFDDLQLDQPTRLALSAALERELPRPSAEALASERAVLVALQHKLLESSPTP